MGGVVEEEMQQQQQQENENENENEIEIENENENENEIERVVVTRRGLVVGNYCHDVLIRDGRVVAETLGGAVSFVSNVLDALLSPSSYSTTNAVTYVSKVGPDFAYSSAVSNHPPALLPHSKTTLFHAHFFTPLTTNSSSNLDDDHDHDDLQREGGGGGEDDADCCNHFRNHDHHDRSLRRLHACDPITVSDLPTTTPFSHGHNNNHPEGAGPVGGDSNFKFQFQFGMAVGVAGEIQPDTLDHMFRICHLVLVDVQALIRTFRPDDGTVDLLPLSDTSFYDIIFHRRTSSTTSSSSTIPNCILKASSEEAPYVDVNEARNHCCVIVTNGKNGCRVYWKDVEMHVPSFTVRQVDPTGAGDSFLGGFTAALLQGLPVTDAALLGNFFGSLTVAQIGVPKLQHSKLQLVKDEMRHRAQQRQHYIRNGYTGFLTLDFSLPDRHEDFREFLTQVLEAVGGEAAATT